MNTSQNTPENPSADGSRPFGFWITAVDRLLAAEFAVAFEDEGITRSDWRILNIIDGTVPLGAKAGSRELPDRKLRHLADLGWIERTAGGWALTADGAAAQARLSTAVEEIRAQVAGALDPEEFAATAASLEKLARGLGYREGMRLPRRPGAPRGDGHHGHHRAHERYHGEHRAEAGSGHGERFGHGRGEHPGVDHSERFGPGHGEHPGFGREWLLHERRRAERTCGEHPHGRSRRGGGHHQHAAEHLHIHLHDGRRNG